MLFKIVAVMVGLHATIVESSSLTRWECYCTVLHPVVESDMSSGDDINDPDAGDVISSSDSDLLPASSTFGITLIMHRPSMCTKDGGDDPKPFWRANKDKLRSFAYTQSYLISTVFTDLLTVRQSTLISSSTA